MAEIPAFNPPRRILMGPGPSGAHPRVLRSMNAGLLGHLDPDFLKIMDGCRAMLREVMRTRNAFTFATPGTGTSGMEAAVMNLVEPGDTVVVGVAGYFADRICQMAQRAGGKVVRVEAPWGTAVDPADVERAVKQAGRVKLLAVVHAETSTGVRTDVEPFARIAHEAGALMLVDCVTSLGGMQFETDDWGVDAAYASTQKCLSAPPGVAPLTLSPAAADAVARRETPCNSWYLDLGLLGAYWDERHAYHHTAPISMIYALYEALAVVIEEGLEARWQRHATNGRALHAGVEAMGLNLFAAPDVRLPVLTTVAVPDGVDEAAVRSVLLNEHHLEVGGGLGELRGKVWRVGLMGEASTEENVLLFLSSLGNALRRQGFNADVGAALATASRELGG